MKPAVRRGWPVFFPAGGACSIHRFVLFLACVLLAPPLAAYTAIDGDIVFHTSTSS